MSKDDILQAMTETVSLRVMRVYASELTQRKVTLVRSRAKRVMKMRKEQQRRNATKRVMTHRARRDHLIQTLREVLHSDSDSSDSDSSNSDSE